jgi:two-component system, NtrC family, sensor kinase
MSLLSAQGCIVAGVEGNLFHIDGAAGHVTGLRDREFPIVESVALRTLKERRVILRNGPDTENDIVFDAGFGSRFSIRNAVAAPLEAGGQPFGVLIAINSLRGSFSEEDALLLQRLADLGSLAVRNARLLERERLSVREARALAEIVQHLNQSLELERVVNLIAEYAADLLGALGATVTMLEADGLRIVGAAGHAVGRFQGLLPLDGAFSGEAIRNKRPVRTHDLRAYPRWRHSADLLSDVSPNALAAPLLVGDRAIGTVLVYGNQRRDFNEHEEDLLQALASHAAIAVENARLYRAAARTARHADILAVTGRTLASFVAPGAIFKGIGRVVTELLGAHGFTVYTVDLARRTTALAHAHGVGSDLGAADGSSFWAGLPGEAASRGEDIVIGDLASDPRAASSPRLLELLNAGIGAIAFLPLIVEGSVRGMLVMRWRTRRTFDEGECELFRDFATQVAIALRNARFLSDLKRRAARLAAVAKVQQAISRTELNDVYAEVHRAAMTSIPGARLFALLLASADRAFFIPQLIVTDGVSTWASALPAVPCSSCAASQALATALPLMSDAPARSWSAYVAGISRQNPVRAEIAVPILHGEEARGVLVVQSYAEHAFDDDDVDVLSLIARQAGTAIENARLFEAERSAREIAETAAGISRSALGSVTAVQTAFEILEAVDRVVPSAGKALGLAIEDEETITYLAASGALQALRGVTVRRGESAAQLVHGRSEALVPSAEALTSTREGNVAPHGAIIFPLIAKNRVLGVLWTVPVAGTRPRAGDLDALRKLAAPVALAADVLLLGEEERRRRERERMLATALATMDQPIVIIGLDRRVWYANAAAMREYQYDLDELTELTFDALVASAVPARRVGANVPASSSSVWLAEHVHRRRDGSQFPASVMLSYIRDDIGSPVGQVLNVRNLTDERRLEEQLRQSEKLAALGELVAGVAHELNNPLAGISAFAQLLLEEELDTEQRDSVRLIKREADRAVGVIRDLLIFSRKTGPTRAPVDLNDILELTLRLRSYSLRSAGVDVRLELDRSIPRVRGDDQRLQQVLLNLIVNAEYALQRASSKRLTVRTQLVDRGVDILVSDTGVGMAEETRQRIFEPFFTTKPAGQGTGLGLSVSYGIVQAHGGSIIVESELGLGTTFRIFLPGSNVDELAVASQA